MNKILFLAANPIDTPRLRLDEESRAIDDVLLKSKYRDHFELKIHGAVRASDLQGLLMRYQPHIVHFSGHGSADGEIANSNSSRDVKPVDSSGYSTGGIILEDDAGNSHPVSSRVLSKVFALLKDNIRCVVLNACYSKPQARAIAQHIDCVVGISTAISDRAAISFATAFYQALGYARNVKTAFELGCGQINLDGLLEKNKPRLICDNAKQLTFVQTQQKFQNATPEDSLANVRSEILDLAHKYADIRTNLPEGDLRTRKMEDVFTDMRILAVKSQPLLQDLAKSVIVGERLAAIAILQTMPKLLQQSDIGLDWIVKRVADERPFVGYHATKTLLAAAHYYDSSVSKGELQRAIDDALETLGNTDSERKRKIDRYNNLMQARQVLQR